MGEEPNRLSGDQPRGLVRSDRGGACKSLPDGPFAKRRSNLFHGQRWVGLVRNQNGRPSDPGLVEGATPECRSPLTLLSYQTAQDELFTEATHRAFGAHAAKLLKNSADAFGHSYGQQENYEVEVASGWRLLCWRMGLLCLLPAILAYKLGAGLWFACVFSLAFLTSFCRRVSDWRSLWDHTRLGNAWVYLVIHGEPIVTQGWVDIAVKGMRLLHAPVAVGLHLLIWMFAIVPHRRYLTGFLASRIIFDGAGHYDRSGRFWLGTKAASVTSVIGFGNYWGEKPIFVTGHWLQAICTDRWNSLSGWKSLFRRKQRIQISVGDATPNTHVEYMRIGVTDLMLDLIESQCDSELPQLSSPLEAMKRFAGDWMLLHRTASVRSHSLLNAIEIQRLYLQAAKRFLQRHWQVPKEAWDVLHQWQGTIDQLNECRTDPNALQWLLGRVDWVSKKWLLDQMDAKASWMIRKKVDLRFHELSEAGYQRKLQDALKLPHLNDSAEVDRARRTPPQGTPATKRGYLIREFASSDEPIRADWDAVEIGIGSAAKIVRLRKPK